MFESEGLPKNLASMAPGPVLAAFLASVDRTRLSGYELVEVMQARSRQLAHDQAELYADMVEVAHSAPGESLSEVARTDVIDEFAADEIRAALTLTRRAADADLGLAWSLRERVPQVWQALHSGAIDLRRARVIANGTSHLQPDAARAVVDTVIGEAPDLTTGQLRARLRRLCLEADADDAAKRYESAVDDRRLVIEPSPDGAADVCGLNLPVDRVNAVRHRINTLARSLKTSAETRTMDQLRADVFLDLLEGAHEGGRVGRRGVVDIHVDLATLVELSESPGEIPGWGPVIADIARQVAADGRAAEWRTTVTDQGNVVWDGITRRRPTEAMKRHVQARRPNCVFPGCRMPARECDLDHTVAYSEGGPTEPRNLGPLCRHDHVTRHKGGWSLRTDGAGRYFWTSRLGHRYVTTGKPP